MENHVIKYIFCRFAKYFIRLMRSCKNNFNTIISYWLKGLLFGLFMPVFIFAQRQSTLNDTVVFKRLQLVQKTIELPYSNVVLERIRQKIYPNREALQHSLSLFKQYENFLETEIQKRNLPIELKYLPFAISEMNPRMTGRYSTAGIWGLNVSVAVKYGLTVNQLIDERFNIEKSTVAALDYIQSLYDIYSDWWKTIIAFTNSPAGLNALIIRLHDPDLTIWDIYSKSKLPFDEIIPDYMYSTYIINYMSSYDLKISNYKIPDHVPITLKKDVLLNDLTDKLKLSDSLFYILNPVFVESRIPANSHYPILLPTNKELLFRQWEDSLYAWAIKPSFQFSIPDSIEEMDEEIDTLITIVTDSVSTEIEDKNIEKPIEKPVEKNTNKPPKTNSGKITHTVKKGDMLGKIATKYKVSVSDIKEWNKLKTDNISIGQKLVIHTNKGSSTNKTQNEKDKTKGEKYIYYTVKKGDTLWSIASKYNGVTDDEIKKLNKIGNSIHPGQVLKIKIK